MKGPFIALSAFIIIISFIICINIKQNEIDENKRIIKQQSTRIETLKTELQATKNIIQYDSLNIYKIKNKQLEKETQELRNLYKYFEDLATKYKMKAIATEDMYKKAKYYKDYYNL